MGLLTIMCKLRPTFASNLDFITPLTHTHTHTIIKIVSVLFGSSSIRAISGLQCYQALRDQEGVKSAARRGLERVEKVIVREPDHGLAIGWGVSSLVALGEAERAKEWAQRAMLLEPDNLNLRYNLSCAMVELRDTDAALELLAPVLAVAQAANLSWLHADNSFDPIRDDARFVAMVAAAEARVAAAR